MSTPPVPEGEAERLQMLIDCDIMDTAAESRFDRLTALAAHICQAPISLITLVDGTRQWFKSRYGLNSHETPRHDAFCAHAILQPGLLIVPDALEDARFADNPLVTGYPHIRFYAGAPLVMSSSHAMGSLCVIDRVPRQLQADHQQALLVLSEHVVSLLEVRLRTNQLAHAHDAMRSLNQRLSERTVALESANDALQSFSHAVAHDLRAPVRAISGYAGMLKEDHAKDLPPEAMRQVDAIQQRATVMDQIINALLDLARLGNRPLVKSTIDVNAVVRTILGEFTTEITRRSIALHITDLTPCHGDAVLVRQLFTNLIDNAIKYTGQCGSPRISISANRNPGEVVYVISDNGAGFDMRYADKLFTPLHRLHAGNEFQGIGIGLATVKRIVDMHGGHISASASVGSGATFTIALPTTDIPA